MKNLKLSEIIKFHRLGDERGGLVAVESGRSIPFDIQRVYFIYETGEGVERGFHSHLDLQQVAIAVSGSLDMVLDDGKDQVTVHLNSPTQGIYIGPGIWRVMKNFSPDCVLLVLADAHYDESDYIRNYDEFLAMKKA